jgi:hypothetical protein
MWSQSRKSNLAYLSEHTPVWRCVKNVGPGSGPVDFSPRNTATSPKQQPNLFFSDATAVSRRLAQGSDRFVSAWVALASDNFDTASNWTALTRF